MTNSNNKSSNSLKILGFGIAEVVFFALAIALFFGILNYFNILSLSQIYPNLFGSLPHQPFKESVQTPQGSIQELKLSCPVEKEFCDKGVKVYDGNKFLGVGYKLPLGKKIFAVIPGTAVFGGAEDKSKDIVSHSKIVIGGIGLSQGYMATYEYFGLPKIENTQIRSVSSSEELGTVWGGSFPDKPPFDGINVLVLMQFNNRDIDLPNK